MPAQPLIKGVILILATLPLSVTVLAQDTETPAQPAEIPSEGMTAAEQPASSDNSTSGNNISNNNISNNNTSGNYTCALNGLVRRVEIAYDNAEYKVPCAVNYYKDSESPNEMSTLWSAQNMAGYCEEKASEFVEKLQSWGWSCNLN